MTVHRGYRVHKSTHQEIEMIVHLGCKDRLNPKITTVLKMWIDQMHLLIKQLIL